MIDIFQAGVAVYLISIKENLYGVILLLMVIPQIYFSGYVFSQKPSRK
jgi:chlorophyll synthase